MRKIMISAAVLLMALACGGTTGPVAQQQFWEDYQWIPVQMSYQGYIDVSYAIEGDSVYFLAAQNPDTSSYFKCHFPDVVSIDILNCQSMYPFFESRVLDGNRAVTLSGILETDDWYEYWYPFGLDDGGRQESIPLQPDDSLGGSNHVRGVFYGLHDGDSTVVFRKPLHSRDNWDMDLVSDSTYYGTLLLIWGQPGDEQYYVFQWEGTFAMEL